MLKKNLYLFKKKFFYSSSPFNLISDLGVSRKNSEIVHILSSGSIALNHQQQNTHEDNRLQSKFQAMLITPSGSKDNLTNEDILLNNGRRSISKPPQSPFSRKLAENQQSQCLKNNITNNYDSNRKLVI